MTTATASDLSVTDTGPGPRRRSRRRRTALAALAAGTAMVLVTACVPPDFVRHQAGPNWSWFGPANWLATHNPNGIVISSPTGSQQVTMAFAPVPCAPGQTALASANNFFTQQRSQFRAGSGLTQWQTLSRAATRRLPENGPNYFRSDFTYSGRAPNGVLMRGEASIDYAINSFGCSYIVRDRIAPNSQFADVIGRLRVISNNINYFGSGVTF